MQITSLLHIGRGVTAVVGSGGKTTLLAALARELSHRGSVILTTTTHIRRPTDCPVLTGSDPASIADALTRCGTVCVGEAAEDGKLTAPRLTFDTLARLADFVLVEADGAKMLPLKAHAPHEPVIPENAQRIVTVVGASGFGHPIATVCHRAERYASLCGASVTETVTPALAARVLKAEGLGDRVYINQVETAEDFENAAALAALLTCPVTAGSLQKEVYLCLR